MTTHLPRIAAAATIIALLTSCATPLGRTGSTVDPITISAVWAQGTSGVGSDVLDALIEGSNESPVTIARPSDPDGEAVDTEGAALSAG